MAQGELAFTEIAKIVGATPQTIYNWRKSPEFKARVDEIREGLCDATYDRGIALRFVRVRALNDRWNRLRRVIEARADDPSMADVPGGSTGLLVHQVKGVGRGDDFQLIHEYVVDTGLLAELRAIEQQAAKELGQWTDKQEVSSQVAFKVYVNVDTERV